MSRWRGAVVLVAVVIAGSACAGPSRTNGDFRHKVANTAEAIQGVIGTVHLAVAAAADDKIPGPYLSVTLAEADDDASDIVDLFDSIQPPSGTADDLRNELDTILQDVVSTLDAVRIAVRRGDIDQLPALARPLDQLNSQLQPLVELA